jgi:hypothetical protein
LPLLLLGLLLIVLLLLALLLLLLMALILLALLRGGLLRVAPFLLPLLRRSLLLTAVVLLLVLMLVFRLLGVAKRAGSESQGHYRCCGEDSNSLHGSSFRTGSEPICSRCWGLAVPTALRGGRERLLLLRSNYCKAGAC